MRTDAKIGFAIGGVLLAVLTVYAIVVPKHSKKTNTTVSLVGSPSTPTTPVVVAPQTTEPQQTPSNPPPIAAAEAPATKDVVTSTTPGIVPSTPAGSSPMVDSTPSAIDGFHPLNGPKELTKSEEKTGKLVDGVYTPENAIPTPARKTARKLAPLPDETADASTANDRQYTIKPGQTLSKIAYEVYGNSRFWVAIQRENKGLDASHLKVGSKINLPDITPLQPGPITVSDEEVAATPVKSHRTEQASTDARSYTVKSGDSLYGIAKRLLGSGRKAEALYALNKDVIGPDKSKLKLGMVLKLPEAAATPLADIRSAR